MRVLTMLAVALVAMAAAAASNDVRRFWAKQHCMPTAESVSFQVYLQKENEHILHEYTSTESVAGLLALGVDPTVLSGPSVEAKLAMWRAVMAPLKSSHDQVKAWLAPAMAQCRADWDSYHCANVPAGIVAKMFGAAVCTYTRVDKKESARLFIDADATTLTIPKSVLSVFGPMMFDPTVHPVHMSRTRPAAATDKKTAKHQPRTQKDKMMHAHVKPHAKSRAGLSSASDWMESSPSGTPQVVEAIMTNNQWNVFLAAIYCSDGSEAKSSWLVPKTPDQWCANGDTPTSVQVMMPGMGSSTVQLTATNCASAAAGMWQDLVSIFDPRADQVVCSLMSSMNFSPNMEYNITLMQMYQSGATSQGMALRNYFGGNVYNNANGDMAFVTLINPQPLLPSNIAMQYGIPSGIRGMANASGQGVIEFAYTEQPQGGFNPLDLENFFVQIGLADNIGDANTYAHKWLHIVNAYNAIPQLETTLDVELMMGLAPYIHTTMYNIIYGPGGMYSSYPQGFLAWAQQITGSNPGLSYPPTAWSISYGGPEWGPQANQLAQYFEIMSASGITVFVSSGDSGSGFYYQNQLTAPAVSFPASAPFVVSVGATALKSMNGQTMEISCSASQTNVITSGGAFSAQFQRPAYQNLAVQQYINNQYQATMPTSNTTFNAQYPGNMRAVPDVAAIGANINVFAQDQHILLYGTSASSPITAAMISLINDALMNAGKGPQKNIHNILYTAMGNFTDVTMGNNCAGEIQNTVDNFYIAPSTECYPTATGWDAVTGLGSTKFAALKQTILRINGVSSMESFNKHH